MTNDHQRSRLDGIIDAVVHEMMQIDSRGDLAGRVRRAVDEPARRPWFVGVPALAAASFAVVVLLAATMLLVRQPDARGIPTIEVASGVPANLDSPMPTPRIPDGTPPPAEPARGTRPAFPPAVASSEAIFGPRRDQVGAASVRPASVWLQLTLVEFAVAGEPRRQPVTIVLPGDPALSGRAVAAGEGAFRVAVTHEVRSGALHLNVEMSTPVPRQFTATIRPGERTQVFEEVDPKSGQRIAIEAAARFLKPDAQR